MLIGIKCTTAQQYVALSRVKSLQGLAVLEVDVQRLTNNVVDPRALAELQRLKAEQVIGADGDAES